MTPQDRPRILLVDDEPAVLEGLSRNLRRRFECRTATSGAEGLELVRGEAPFAVVVSDMRMPGLDGAGFLARVRLASPDSVRVLLTGHADVPSAIAAVNDGQIFRFLTKPCPPEALADTLEAAASQHQVAISQRVLLEQTLAGTVRALSDVLAMASPLAFGRASRLHRTVAALCDRLGVLNRWPMEVAAQLSQLGAIQLPVAVAEKLHLGQPLTPAEQELADRVPQAADPLLAHLPHLEPVREILAAAGARFDAPGGPPPLGARLLRLATDLDGLEASGLTATEAASLLRSRRGLYDPDALEALAAEVGSQAGREVLELPLTEVRPGMLVAADVRTRAGVLLVARGFTVTASLLMRLHHLGPSLAQPLRVTSTSGAPTPRETP